MAFLRCYEIFRGIKRKINLVMGDFMEDLQTARNIFRIIQQNFHEKLHFISGSETGT